jgi:hypothetical protein
MPLQEISSSIWPHCRASPAISNGPILKLLCPIGFLASCLDAHSPSIIDAPPREPLGKPTCTLRPQSCTFAALLWVLKVKTGLLWGLSSFPSIPTLRCSLSIQCKPSARLAPLVASTMPQVFLLAKCCHALTWLAEAQGCSFYPCWCCFSCNAGWQTAFAFFLMLTQQDDGPCFGLGRSD